ncbi:MAG: zinc ABC transporter substrate-binding protein [Reyranella sp.]|uniref:metal ABC transporter solute-binding protein, Zn/Mn family n=1 Tax=Reyranella sp. TaxID=1929291 RepID=UPI001AC8A56F|nr:zinc ABC transporter substrate-binding protein [Reyranella sp.]MBN9091274.1 zinc ABC transporter substrate-binding protein [Reyranella sp.]
MRFACLLLAVLLTAAPAWADSRLKVVATFSILADLVREVGGEAVEVTTLVGPDSDAHTYQPRPTDARTLATAKVLVSNGLGFEGWIDRLADAAGFKGTRIVASAGAPAEADPHCWQDVACTRRYIANIAQGLARADPANAAAYRDRAAQYDQRLAALDDWIRREIAGVPEDRRQAITGHSSFRYFARAYDVRFSAPRGYSTDSEPTARDVANLIRHVREQKVKAVFVENMTNPSLVAEIARDSGAVVGPRLYSDALSRPDGPAATYEAMMRHNVSALVAGMQRN